MADAHAGRPRDPARVVERGRRVPLMDPTATGRPFTDAEYRDRARRVREEMARRDVDVLLVLSPPNLYYLTGFESIWYPPRAPVGVVVSPSATTSCSSTTSATRRSCRRSRTSTTPSSTTTTTAVDDDRGRVPRPRLVRRHTIGVECWTTDARARRWSREIADAHRRARRQGRRRRLDRRPRARGQVARPSWSACGARREIADAAFAVAGRDVRPGRTELADRGAAGRRDGRARAASSRRSARWSRPAPTSGAARTRRRAAARSSAGDVMYVDCCGVVDRYHVDLCRTFAIGRDHPQARAILDVRPRGSVDAVIAAVRAGRPARRRPARGRGVRLLALPARAGLVGRRLRARASPCRPTGSATPTSRTTPSSSSRGSPATSPTTRTSCSTARPASPRATWRRC